MRKGVSWGVAPKICLESYLANCRYLSWMPDMGVYKHGNLHWLGESKRDHRPTMVATFRKARRPRGQWGEATIHDNS
jgi:hypothetical protein